MAPGGVRVLPEEHRLLSLRILADAKFEPELFELALHLGASVAVRYGYIESDEEVVRQFVPGLNELLGDHEGRVPKEALQNLLLIAEKLDPQVRQGIARRGNRLPELRALAANVNRLRDSEDVGEVIEALRNGGAPTVRHALAALRSIGPAAVQQAAHWVLSHCGSANAWVRQEVAATLGLLPREAGLSALTDLLGDTNKGVRRQAVESYAAVAGPEGLGVLLSCLRDPDGVVRVEACEQLTGRQLDGLTDALMPLLQDELATVRERAFVALAEADRPLALRHVAENFFSRFHQDPQKLLDLISATELERGLVFAAHETQLTGAVSEAPLAEVGWQEHGTAELYAVWFSFPLDEFEDGGVSRLPAVEELGPIIPLIWVGKLLAALKAGSSMAGRDAQVLIHRLQDERHPARAVLLLARSLLRASESTAVDVILNSLVAASLSGEERTWAQAVLLGSTELDLRSHGRAHVTFPGVTQERLGGICSPSAFIESAPPEIDEQFAALTEPWFREAGSFEPSSCREFNPWISATLPNLTYWARLRPTAWGLGFLIAAELSGPKGRPDSAPWSHLPHERGSMLPGVRELLERYGSYTTAKQLKRTLREHWIARSYAEGAPEIECLAGMGEQSLRDYLQHGQGNLFLRRG